MKTLTKYRKYLTNTLIVSLIAAAVVAVASVLIGSFSDTSIRIIWILVSIVVHSLLCIALLNQEEGTEKYEPTKNMVYALIPVSFATSVLGITTVISSELSGQLYALFGLILAATLHCNLLWLFKGASKLITRVSTANMTATVALAGMLVPIIFVDNNGDFYNRLLAAVGIVDATLSVLTVIFYKLYSQRTLSAPKLSELFRARKGKLSVWAWLLILFLLLQIVPMIIFGLVSLFSSL